MNDRLSNEFAKAIRQRALQAVLVCALCWGVGTALVIIGAFVFLTEAIGIAVAALLYAVVLLIPVFHFELFRLGSFEGRITDIDCQRRYKLYMIKPGVGEHAVQYRSEYTLYIQKDNGKVTTVTYVVKEDRELPYAKGDRVRYRWGVPYMQTLSVQEKHPTVCPFCGQAQPHENEICQSCGKQIIDNDYEQSEASK